MRRMATWVILLLAVSLALTACSKSTSSTPDIKQAEHQDEETENNQDSGLQQNLEPVGDQQESQEKESADPEEKSSPIETPQKLVFDHPPFVYPDEVRGIYVTGHSAGGERFKYLLNLLNTTKLNAMVIDVKDDYGNITFKVDGELEPFSKPFIKDPKALMQILSDNNIYPIARIVVFKDSILAGQKPEYSFKEAGKLWKNRRGEAFVNPFVKEVWEHNLEIAKEAAKLGFQEIQFDYVRFPEGFEKRDATLTYTMGDYTKEKLEPRLQEEWEALKPVPEENQQEQEAVNQEAVNQDTAQPQPQPAATNTQPVYDSVAARVTAVTDFVAYAKQELEPYGVQVSVDIFGYTATLREAPGIGQNFTKISKHVDVISSMIYPSHWGPGYFNIPKPDIEPFRLVQEYAKMEQKKLSELENPPISRPWIQDFTASWLGKGNYIPYGKKEVEAQIRALNETGVKEFLLWNAGNRYTENVNYTPLD